MKDRYQHPNSALSLISQEKPSLAFRAVTVSTQVQGVVSGVNLNSNPPTLKVNGQNVQISQVTAISQ